MGVSRALLGIGVYTRSERFHPALHSLQATHKVLTVTGFRPYNGLAKFPVPQPVSESLTFSHLSPCCCASRGALCRRSPKTRTRREIFTFLDSPRVAWPLNCPGFSV